MLTTVNRLLETSKLSDLLEREEVRERQTDGQTGRDRETEAAGVRRTYERYSDQHCVHKIGSGEELLIRV